MTIILVQILYTHTVPLFSCMMFNTVELIKNSAFKPYHSLVLFLNTPTYLHNTILTTFLDKFSVTFNVWKQSTASKR